MNYDEQLKENLIGGVDPWLAYFAQLQGYIDDLIDCKTKEERQVAMLHLVASLSDFNGIFSTLEQKYYQGLKNCVDSEGSKSAGELLMAPTEVATQYRSSKRLIDIANSALSVGQMYTGR